jgi:methylated-DNA-protein-cysteine methyltransferase-like protein
MVMKRKARGEPAVDAEAARSAILAVVARIPRGRVAAYGQVAWAAGLPGRARLVGRILGEGIAADLPWFRVINARGEISLPKNSPAAREQRRRLREEAVIFENGRVSLRRYGWREADASPLID